MPPLLPSQSSSAGRSGLVGWGQGQGWDLLLTSTGQSQSPLQVSPARLHPHPTLQQPVSPDLPPRVVGCIDQEDVWPPGDRPGVRVGVTTWEPHPLSPSVWPGTAADTPPETFRHRRMNTNPALPPSLPWGAGSCDILWQREPGGALPRWTPCLQSLVKRQLSILCPLSL